MSATAPDERPTRRDEAVVVFDLDGTLLDSDQALLDAFVALDVPADEVTYGHVVADECRRLGITVQAYLDAYDTGAAAAFAGVDEVLGALERWAVCSNKDDTLATAELQRLGWDPEVARFAGSFDGPKRLEPVLDALGLAPGEAVFVGDTDHDRRCAAEAGVRFVLAAWNPRAEPREGDLVAHRPAEVLGFLPTR